MKRLTIIALASLGLSSGLSLGLALSPATARANAATGHQLTPAQLVNLAYRGEIEGIPGYQRFVNNRYRASEVVELAIAAGNIPAETLEDERYLNAVRSQLRGFRPHRFND